MLRSMNGLEKYTIRAIDGTIGHVRDCYFDDQGWVIRYLVVDAGSWLLSREVPISPIAVAEPDWAGKVLPASITREQVRNSPSIDTRRPVSRQHEIQWLGYYGYPYYWQGPVVRGDGAYPSVHTSGLSSPASTAGPAESSAAIEFAAAEAVGHANDDVHLRSCEEVIR
jgi:hypothetical protein